MNLLEANALDLIATVEELNNTEVTWTLLSTTPVQNDFSVPNDVYIPRKSSRVSVTFRDADLVNFLPAALDINVGYP